ncbi:MAG: redox-sensing transcriptional repressor Rex [Chloroflexi bacterium]|nr:redox-sensing transcriptional repressor Rex [Chloroflexota bacterium]
MVSEIPEVVVLRLPLYVRALSRLQDESAGVISSQELGELLQITPAQIRKDLSYFGRFGKQGKGYTVSYLLGELRQILGLEREWSAVLVGVGRLGRAILSYPGFTPAGFRVVAAFDVDTNQIGKRVDGIRVRDISELEDAIKRDAISIAIVAVPASEAQRVIDRLVQCGVKAILNYAPVSPQIPGDVKVRNVDPVLALQTMTFHLKNLELAGKRPEGKRGKF